MILMRSDAFSRHGWPTLSIPFSFFLFCLTTYLIFFFLFSTLQDFVCRAFLLWEAMLAKTNCDDDTTAGGRNFVFGDYLG